MDREVRYRLFRIVLVLFILAVLSFLRTGVQESYVEAREIENSFINPLVMEEVSSNDLVMNNDNSWSYKFKISNNSSLNKEALLVFRGDDTISINYQVLEEGKVLKTGNLEDNNILLSLEIDSNSYAIYEVRFFVNDNNNSKQSLNGEIALI